MREDHRLLHSNCSTVSLPQSLATKLLMSAVHCTGYAAEGIANQFLQLHQVWALPLSASDFAGVPQLHRNSHINTELHSHRSACPLKHVDLSNTHLKNPLCTARAAKKFVSEDTPHDSSQSLYELCASARTCHTTLTQNTQRAELSWA